MKTLKITAKEERALRELLNNSFKCCNSGCVYSEMQNSRKNCEECNFTLSINSILDKIGE